MAEQLLLNPNFAANPTVADRQQLLDTFSERPDDQAVWNTAYAWARAEGDHPDNQSTITNIPAEELIAMANAVRSTPPDERYNLMTCCASDGRRWFDVIEGFSMHTIRQVSQNVVKTWAEQNQVSFHRVLDLATGTGKSLTVLEQHADHVVGVDRNQALLDIAKERAGDNTSLVHADITRLPFEDESFDMASSLGIEASLDQDSQVAFYTELARVLMPGSAYISAFYNYPYLPSEDMAKITQTSKAMLADMICDTVSGGASITERLDDEQTDALFARLGLHRQYYLDAATDSKNQAIVQIITKDQP